MTPKNKAYRLFLRYFDITTERPDLFEGDNKRAAKRCAQIAADEMLKNAGFIWGGSKNWLSKSARDNFRDYWNSVKEEIQKL